MYMCMMTTFTCYAATSQRCGGMQRGTGTYICEMRGEGADGGGMRVEATARS